MRGGRSRRFTTGDRYRERPWRQGLFCGKLDGTKILLIGILLILLIAPSSAAPASVDIVVATVSDLINGDVTTVARLLANPGPDGISLREAIQATDNDPGQYMIRFAPALAGATITVEQLPPLTGGGVTIEGDIDGNGKPDVVLRPAARPPPHVPWGLQISSSGNILHALTLDDFPTGVMFQPYWPHWLPDPGPFPAGRTYSDNVVTDLVLRGGVGTSGIGFDSVQSLDCNPSTSPCSTHNRWTTTTVAGNTIETGQFGIVVSLNAAIADRIEGLALTDNTIRLGTGATPAEGGTAIMLASGGNSTQTRISDVVIARNSIEGVNGDGGIFVAAGLQRAQANTIEHVQILDNRVRVVRQPPAACCFAIVVEAGQDTWAVNVRPVNYPSRNVLRDIRVTGNSVSGSLAAGVKLGAGMDAGGSENRIENVRIERNVIHSTMMGKGVYLWAGDILPFEGTYARRNRITGVMVVANRITTGRGKPLAGETSRRSAGGIVLLAGWHYGRGGVVTNVRITRNRIATAYAGVRLIGGIGPTARGNRVSCVRLARNRITGTRASVSVKPNLEERKGEGPTPGTASGNRASLGGC